MLSHIKKYAFPFFFFGFSSIPPSSVGNGQTFRPISVDNLQQEQWHCLWASLAWAPPQVPWGSVPGFSLHIVAERQLKSDYFVDCNLRAAIAFTLSFSASH